LFDVCLLFSFSVLFVCDCFVANYEQHFYLWNRKSNVLFVVCFINFTPNNVGKATYPHEGDPHQRVGREPTRSNREIIHDPDSKHDYEENGAPRGKHRGSASPSRSFELSWCRVLVGSGKRLGQLDAIAPAARRRAAPVSTSSNAEEAPYSDATVTKGNGNAIQQSTHRCKFAHT
jgi:hypothetical protein